MTITEHLAEYALSLAEGEICRSVLDAARPFFLDALACLFLGIESDSVRMTIPYVKAYGGTEGCVFPGKEALKTDAAHGAMLGAMSAHSSDFDDMSLSLNGHPSALLVPVLFSLGQKEGASGEEMLRAYIAGVEIDAILGRSLSEIGYRKGLNTTCYLGVIGAAAAAGCLLHLDRDQLVNAMGIAINEASGFKANYGTPAKDAAIGMAALKAVTAAELARAGMKASADSLEGPFGLMTTLCGEAPAERVHRLIDEHEWEFLSPGLIMKPYPSCRGNHSGIDCLTAILRDHPFDAQELEEIVCHVDQAAFDTDRYQYPQTPGEAKFSLAFCLACIILHGKIEIEDFLGEKLRDTAPLSLIPRVKIVCSPEEFPESHFGTRMEVRLKNGTVYRETVCFASGHPRRPMSKEAVQQKLMHCLRHSFSREKAEELAALLERFDSLGRAEQIIEYLYSDEKKAKSL